MEKPKPNLSSQKNTQKVDPKVVRAAPLPNPQTPQRQIRPAPNFQAQTIQIIHPGQQSATPLVINNGQIQMPSSASVQSPNQRVVFLQPIQGQNGQVIYTQTPNAATASPQPIQPKLSSTPNQVLIRPVQQPVKTEKGTRPHRDRFKNRMCVLHRWVLCHKRQCTIPQIHIKRRLNRRA